MQQQQCGPTYVFAYDIGTTGVKTCLYAINETISLLAAATKGYSLTVSPDGSAEQIPDEWWDALCVTTREVFSQTDVTPQQVAGISFCSQMQGLVLVDENGKALRNAMSYMDQRAREQLKKGLAHGPQIAGANVFKLLKSLKYTGAVAASVKDPVWKYNWVKENEPAVFSQTYRWLDVKEYLIGRMTGEFVMTRDSAFAALLYDIHKGAWSGPMLKMLCVNPAHMPKIVNSEDCVGTLTAAAASQLGLCEGTRVFGGGGDASLIGVGAGSGALGDTHVYNGTSGWVSTVVDKSIVDTSAMIAAIVGAQDGLYNYFAELETAGKCLEWVRDHLALDEIGIFLKKTHVADSMEGRYTSLYDYLSEIIDATPAGSGGVLFTPWLHGNRCPFEDPNARGMFFNISLETGKTELIRSVIEGVCYHMKWFLETQDKKVKTASTVRFVGGGALSAVTCQILADVTGRIVETVDEPQNVGAVGAAAVAAVGLGLIKDVGSAKQLIPAKETYTPNPATAAVHARNYKVYCNLYKSNKDNFKALNEDDA